MTPEIKFEFEDIPDDFTFGCSVDHSPSFGNVTWGTLKEEFKETILTDADLMKKFENAGIRRVQIGSYAWHYLKNGFRPRGRFFALSTMHWARVLKR